jgi:two-component system, cell cycle sensor histidine kinase and response regulator CckA
MAHRILFVNDEDTLRSIAARALRFKEYEVVEASDGFEAWGLAKKTRFDLVITDSRMTPLSGAELMARLRDLQPTVPILRLSDSHDAGSEESGTRTLFKPFEVDDLVVAVGSLLAR